MRGMGVVLAFALVCLLSLSAWAQPGGDQVQQMREQLRSLQEKLSALESSQPERPYSLRGANARVTVRAPNKAVTQPATFMAGCSRLSLRIGTRTPGAPSRGRGPWRSASPAGCCASA